MLDKVLNRFGPKDKGPWCFTNYSEDSNFMESCDLPLQGVCEFECHCKKEEPCFYLGSCPHGCHPGWMNATCQTKCESGRYGDGCNSNCGECKSGPCNIETGECEGGCAAGWKGTLCKTECDPGRYGANCSEVCGHCLSGSCRFVTGACVGGCIPGWQGEKCQDRRCHSSSSRQLDNVSNTYYIN
ncbi:scavenger receptor class F member 2-like [Crassostrea angulata]|uniref:scavenger receptor class F member 2-like n=1 Tax=Magallana angulata TaxID=2784310 RepID=UPI0022B09F29|nr:scavenger receptor class F member 2-like [Crassostrea angulata]